MDDKIVSFQLDVGIIPEGYLDSGKFLVTMQAGPMPDRMTADIIARAIKETICTRFGVIMEEGVGNA